MNSKVESTKQRIALTKFERFSCARKHPLAFLIFDTFVHIFSRELIKSCKKFRDEYLENIKRDYALSSIATPLKFG